MGQVTVDSESHEECKEIILDNCGNLKCHFQFGFFIIKILENIYVEARPSGPARIKYKHIRKES